MDGLLGEHQHHRACARSFPPLSVWLQSAPPAVDIPARRSPSLRPPGCAPHHDASSPLLCRRGEERGALCSQVRLGYDRRRGGGCVQLMMHDGQEEEEEEDDAMQPLAVPATDPALPFSACLPAPASRLHSAGYQCA
jgi:hypothetical protein